MKPEDNWKPALLGKLLYLVASPPVPSLPHSHFPRHLVSLSLARPSSRVSLSRRFQFMLASSIISNSLFLPLSHWASSKNPGNNYTWVDGVSYTLTSGRQHNWVLQTEQRPEWQLRRHPMSVRTGGDSGKSRKEQPFVTDCCFVCFDSVHASRRLTITFTA